MVDGKICNSLINTVVTQKCFICGAVPTNMNDIQGVLQRPVNENALLFVRHTNANKNITEIVRGSKAITKNI